MTIDDDDYFKLRKTSSSKHESTKKTPAINEAIEEEESEEKYGLDFLESYQNKKPEIRTTDKMTSPTLDFVASPVSKPSFKKRVSVKNVTRRASFSSGGKELKKRKFTNADNQ